MSEFVATLRLFAVAVLISFSLAVGTAAVGSTMRAHAPVVAVVDFPAELELA